MKKILLVLCLFASLHIAAQNKLPFQGKLLNNNTAFTGTATFVFSIDDPVWSETHPDVVVQDGYYSVVLGEITPLPKKIFGDSSELSMNLSVNGEVLSPVTLYSPLLPYTGSEPIEIDTLRTFMVEAMGIDNQDNPVGKARLRTTNNGYDGVMSLTDSLGRTVNFMQTTKSGGYLQLAQQDFTDNSFRSAALMATFGDQNSYMDLYGANATDDGIQLMVDVYASNIDLEGPIEDGYRRGGLDIYNYFGNPTHNLFSEHIGANTISHLNLNASTDGGGPIYTVNINSGDAETSGGNMVLRDQLGSDRIYVTGNLNNSGGGGIEVYSDGTNDEFMQIRPGGISGGTGSFDNGFNLNYDASGGALLEMFSGSNLNIFLQGNSGDITATGNISGNTLQSTDGTVQTSDRRLKKNIQDLDNPLEKVLDMRGVSYTWKDKNKSQHNQIGVIAQEVEKIYPEFVKTDENGMKAVNYAQMTAVLIEAVKELNKKVEDLEKENFNLKASNSKINGVKKELEQIKRALGLNITAGK